MGSEMCIRDRALHTAVGAEHASCLAIAYDGIADAVRQRSDVLVQQGYPSALLALLPPDLRRTLMPSDDDVGSRIALRTRAALRQHALAAVDDEGPSVLSRAKRHAPDLAPLLAELPTLLGAIPALVLAAKESSAALHTLLDAAHFLHEACEGEDADYSLVHVVLRTIRAALRLSLIHI